MVLQEVIVGMPEAVSKYVASGDLLEVQRVLNDLVIAVQADFAKYKSRVSAARLQEVYNTVALQMGKNLHTYIPIALKPLLRPRKPLNY